MLEDGNLDTLQDLNIPDEELLASVNTALTHIAAASLELGYPTAVSVPHSIIKGLKNISAVSVATGYNYPNTERLKTAASEGSIFASAEETKEGVEDEEFLFCSSLFD